MQFLDIAAVGVDLDRRAARGAPRSRRDGRTHSRRQSSPCRFRKTGPGSGAPGCRRRTAWPACLRTATGHPARTASTFAISSSITASTRSINVLILEVSGDFPQRFGRAAGADEVHLEPRHAEPLLDHVGHVIDRAVAHHAIQVGHVGVLELLHRRVAAERGHQIDPAPLEQVLEHEGVAADVVLAQQADVELARRRRIVQPDHVLEQAVVGDMMARRLAYAAVSLATEGEDVDAELLLHFPRDGVNVVADQADGASGKDGDGLGMKNVEGLLDGRAQPLHAAKDDVLFLHVRREAIGHEVVVFGGRRPGLVAPREPGVEAAADRAVRDVDDVARRARAPRPCSPHRCSRAG